MNILKQTLKGNYKMKKIEYKDVEKAAAERNEITQFCRILTENLHSLRKFNKVTHLIDEANVFEVSIAEKYPGARRELSRIVSAATPFGGISATDEKVDEILFVLTTSDLNERRNRYPRFGNIAPLKPIAPPTMNGRTLSREDFTIKKDQVIATDALMNWIENATLYRVENETQEMVYNLSTAIARNFQELAAIYSKHGMTLNREMFMRQLFYLSNDVDEFRLDENNLFLSILSLFK